MSAKLKSFLPFIGLIVLAVLFAFFTKGRVFSANNIEALMNQAFTVILVSLGVTLITAHGGMDFSVGAVLAISEMVAAIIFKMTGAPVLIIVFCIITSVVCGFITGMITIRLNISPFIASLCMQFAVRGFVNAVLTGKAVGVTELSAPDWTVKLPVLAVMVIVMYLILRYTLIGKYNKAIGENIQAAKMSGVNINRYRLYAYLISGVFLGVAAYFDLLRSGSISTMTGVNFELDVIIALVLGGLSLTGGYETSVRSAVIGGLVIVVMVNGLTAIGVKSNYIGMIEGMIFIMVVLSTYNRDRRGLLPR